jgi:cell division protein FtsL
MTRVHLLLLLMVIICALSVVTSQDKARKLFAELQKEKDRSQQMEVEWGQLQLEQSTWAMHARVEKIAAADRLGDERALRRGEFVEERHRCAR